MLRSHGRAVSRWGARRWSRAAATPKRWRDWRRARAWQVSTRSACSALAERLWGILGLGVEERMETFGVRRDRAEVIGVAAVVFNTLGEWLGARQMVVPGVGVREGILHDLAAAHFGPATAHDERAEALRQQARRFAARMHSDAAHCEHVRRLAAQLFDQLAPVHGLPPSQRVPLELGALLHEVGFAVNARDYHKHGEYLVRNADIPGLGRHQQALVACLVRYHGEAIPKPHHRLYRSLAPAESDRVRQLAALLRIAVALDARGTQTVRRIEIRVQGKTIWLRVAAAPDARVDFRNCGRNRSCWKKSLACESRWGARAGLIPHWASAFRAPEAWVDFVARRLRCLAAQRRKSCNVADQAPPCTTSIRTGSAGRSPLLVNPSIEWPDSPLLFQFPGFDYCWTTLRFRWPWS